jgi:hypothetical protein
MNEWMKKTVKYENGVRNELNWIDVRMMTYESVKEEENE